MNTSEPQEGRADMGLSAYHTTYRLLRETVRDALVDAVKLAYRSARIGSVPCRVAAALYALLLEHPVDRRGRCSSCGWTGMVFGRRRRCRVYRVAQHWLHQHWLHQPPALLVSSLARELGLTIPPRTGCGTGTGLARSTITDRTELNDTDPLPTIEAAPTGLTTPGSPDHPGLPGDPPTSPGMPGLVAGDALVTGEALCLV